MIGWCSRTMAQYGNAGGNNRIHADPTCKMGPDPMIQVEVWDGLLFPSSRPASAGVAVKWCSMCSRPVMPGVWSRRAACQGADPDLFFPSVESHANDRYAYTGACAICRRCAVLSNCRRFALEHEPGFGMWGGLTRKGRDRARLAMTDDAATIGG